MTTKTQIKIWGLPVRVFHWSLVLLFTTAYITKDNFITVHIYVAYTIIALIIFRIIRGLVGPKYERFTNFVYTPSKIIDYSKDVLHNKAKRYLGHNPLGGSMVIALLISLTITIITGFVVYATEETSGPLVNLMYTTPDYIFNIIGRMHRLFSKFTLFLIFFHVVGVVLASLAHKENLIRSMITGKKDSE